MRPISTNCWIKSSWLLFCLLTLRAAGQDIIVDTPGEDTRVTVPRVERRMQAAGELTRIRASVPTTWTVIKPENWKQVHAVSDTAVIFQMPAEPVWILQGLGERAVLVILDPGDKPVPPVDPPIDPPKPPVDPPKPPLPGPGLKVVVIEERADRPKLPPAQARIFGSAAVRTYLNNRAPKSYRFFDQDDKPGADDPLGSAAMARPRTSVPWIIIANESTGFEGKLPADEDAVLELLKKFGGP